MESQALSNREMQVADLIHQGYIDKEIADKLSISTETARTHRKNIHRKLHARNSADVTRIFLTKLCDHAVYIIFAIALYLLFEHSDIIDTIKATISELLKPIRL